MTRLDCKDIKALLSGLIDGELDEETRHSAERHLGDCASCRRVMDEAEGLDELVQTNARSLVDPRGLPAGFEDEVLSRTTRAHPRSYFQQWTTWTGWFAAAAALGLAIFIWTADQPRRAPDYIPPVVSYSDGTGLVSTHFDGTLSADAIESLEASMLEQPTLTSEDAATLYGVRLQLEGVALDADIEVIREAIEYDELLDRLAATTDRLDDAEERKQLFTAQLVLERVMSGELTPDLRELAGDLAEQVADIARTDAYYAL
jgi:hypothetical protein